MSGDGFRPGRRATLLANDERLPGLTVRLMMEQDDESGQLVHSCPVRIERGSGDVRLALTGAQAATLAMWLTRASKRVGATR